MDVKNYLENLINNELARLANTNEYADTALITKLIDGYVEYAQASSLLQAIVQLANGDIVMRSVNEILSSYDLDEETLQSILEHAVSCVRLNCCDTTRILLEKMKNVDAKIIEKILGIDK